ncbi:hypothetical protein PCANC_03544 [Puccinia coronata f. sp. avenae]|uniref:Uncharacterized protein n=1 Tax=Puccinia coronata f. sp. avenae TaxID=200324 RepID=A0A2N5W0A2_9BASI|nr:hypothetical protein PCANC_03544 [Puccinia coronata f. sp. avenae]
MAASDSTTSMADILDTIPSSLDTTGIVQLMPPGPDSNYSDWSFVMTLYLCSLKLCHVIESVEPKDRPASWVGDTCAVGFLIVRTIHHSNLRFIRAHGKDAHKMWMSLKDVHEAAVSGGHNASSSRIVSALKQKALCRKSRRDEDVSPVSAARAQTSRPRFDVTLYCSFCRRSGHDLNICENASRVLQEQQSRRLSNSSDCPQRFSSSNQSNDSSCSRRPNTEKRSSLTPAKAGLTTVAELGNDSHYDGSDYSGAEVAGSTVVVFNHLPESCKASPKIFHPETSFSSDSTVPRVVNPQQPRKKPSSSDQLIADKSSTSKSDSVVNTSGNKKKSSELRLSIDRTTLKPNDLLTNNEKTGINDFKSGKPAPKTDQPKDKVLIRALSEVVQYGGLKLWAGRLSLLKHDPGALGLIPTSVKDHRFIPTTTTAEVKDLLAGSIANFDQKGETWYLGMERRHINS